MTSQASPKIESKALTLTVNAHINPATTVRLRVYEPANGFPGFVSLGFEDPANSVALLAHVGCSGALRVLAACATEAATVLDRMAAEEVAEA